MDAQEYRELREQTGLTQAMCAEFLGVSRETVNRRETGAPISMEAGLAIRSMVKQMRIGNKVLGLRAELDRAANKLGQSDCGRIAMTSLLELLRNGCLSLDGENQKHFLKLLEGAWGKLSGTARDCMINALESQSEEA